jgi:hypothetical protein
MHTDLAYSLEDTLHKRYGKNNLKLKKVAYIDDGETFGDKHVVDYILFDILKEGNVVGELKLTSKQLYINLIMGSNPGGTFREIDPNYNSLNCLSSFDVYSGPCRYSMPWFLYSGKDRREEDNYKVVESKGRQDKIKAWMNKMDITFGGCIKTRDGILEKCNITTIESISIPDFVYVNKDAFSESSIKEVRITSPETIILPFNDIRKTLLTDDMIKYSKKLRYKNKFKEDIKFVEAYDAESGENPYELNSLQKTYFMNKLITFDMKFGTNRFMTQRIVDQEFEI